MKKIILVLFCLCALLPVFAQENFNITGLNEGIYTYRADQDSLKNYFSDRFNFRLDYNKFSFGMKFLAFLPEYKSDSAQLIGDLSYDENSRNNRVKAEWSERFLSYKTDNMLVYGGTIEESFGSGMIFHAYEDRYADKDNRLDGALVKYNQGIFSFKGLYGLARTDNLAFDVRKNDIASGADVELTLIPVVNENWLSLANPSDGSHNFAIKLAGNVSSFHYLVVPGDYAMEYNNQTVVSGRVTINSTLLDWNTEYAHTKTYHPYDDPRKIGYAWYSNMNLYLGKFTYTSGYKNYDLFKYGFMDLPTLNHYDELVVGNPDGLDKEEGFLQELKYNPDMESEYMVSYAKAWNRNFNTRGENLYLEAKTAMGEIDVKAEVEWRYKTESILARTVRENEINPALILDYTAFELPNTFKYHHKFTKHTQEDIVVVDTVTYKETEKSFGYEPSIQYDVSFSKCSVSLLAAHAIRNQKDLFKGNPYIGVEVSAPIQENTSLKVFVGKEKGGKVCRNGVCHNTAPFNGARVELTTKF